jgi:NADPH:quinone reductase-like Zn-dependent oxidoreductase
VRTMSKAVRFNEYGGRDVLRVVDVPVPEPEDGQVLVQVKAAAINPGEAKIREGFLHERWPATFPSGQGSDLAGVVVGIGAGVDGFAVGDEVLGFTDSRASHAEHVVVPAENLTAKPANVSWEVAGSLAVAASTAYAAVRAVSPKPGETVVVAGATGGVGSVAVQLARRTGADVLGIAGPTNHDWLAGHGIKPVAYGEDLADRLRAAGIDALVDAHGGGYVRLAIDLGVPPDRINTVVDFPAVAEYGVKAAGSDVKSAPVLAELVGLVAGGELEVPIAATFPLDDVRAAYERLAQGRVLGKIVLVP